MSCDEIESMIERPLALFLPNWLRNLRQIGV
jgi:hypothetical protein